MAEYLIPSDPVLGAVLQANSAAGLPAYDVTSNQASTSNRNQSRENTKVLDTTAFSDGKYAISKMALRKISTHVDRTMLARLRAG
jgi:hypothetical protein